MKKASKNKSKDTGQFDTFNEPRTIPGQWDVSGFDSIQKSSSDQVDDDQCTVKSPSKGENEVIKSEPSGIKYLDPEYEDDQKNNRKWRSY